MRRRCASLRTITRSRHSRRIGADQALDVGILPGARWRGDDFSDAHARDSTLKDVAVDAVSILVQPAGRRVLPKCIDQLLSGPRSRRMIGDVEMHDECGNGEGVHRRGRCEVIRQKRPPGLRRGTRVRFHQARHRAFRNVDPKCAQFTVNARRSPQRVRCRHLSNERADCRIPPPAMRPARRSSSPSRDLDARSSSDAN
jgi:hypothetical protein